MKQILAAGVAGVFLNAASLHAQQIALDDDALAAPIVEATNAYRTDHGLKPLQRHAALMRAAQTYAEYLARNNSTGHGADGRNAMQRIAAAGAYKPCFAAENVFDYWSEPHVAEPAAVAEAAMRGWKKSPGHDANLRHRRAEQIGVGAAAWTHGDRHYYKVVQVFGDACDAARPPQR